MILTNVKYCYKMDNFYPFSISYLTCCVTTTVLEITFLIPAVILIRQCHFLVVISNSGRSVGIYLKIPVSHHGWETKKFCNLDCLKQPFQRFFTIFYSKIQHLFPSKFHSLTVKNLVQCPFCGHKQQVFSK